jgi:hypothetical protein
MWAASAAAAVIVVGGYIADGVRSEPMLAPAPAPTASPPGPNQTQDSPAETGPSSH